jgi:methenyltetrahydromethanopterin cyclohydrolase
VDAGINCPGGLEAGRRITEICMGGLGTATFNTRDAHWPLTINIHSTHPVLACLASQYAGWSLSHGEGKEAFHALGSGPGRALAVKEPLFAELGYKDDAKHAVLVLEVDRQPPAEILAKIRRDCAVPDDGVTIILTPTRSLAGTVQVVGRVLEVALHKVHALGFPLTGIVDGSASAPIAPPAPDFLNAMGPPMTPSCSAAWRSSTSTARTTRRPTWRRSSRRRRRATTAVRSPTCSRK